jgi:2,4-diaminopentanoate dehydrogenase
MAASSAAPRIIIHGAGNVGQRLTRFCLKKNWPIVAVYNRAGNRVGQDMGRLVGFDRDLGIKVEDFDQVDLASVKADIALIATTDFFDHNVTTYLRYLGAGINVLTHNAQAYNPWFEKPDMAREIDRVARENGVTFTGGGIWDTTRLWSAIIAAGTCLEIESVTHTAKAEIGRPGARFEAEIGVGMTVEEYKREFGTKPNPLNIYLHAPAVMVLQKLGCTVTDVKKGSEPVVFDEPVYSPYSKTEFPAGIVVGARIFSDVSTREGIKGKVEVEYRLFKPHETEDLRWDIKGMPGLGISVRRDDTQNLSAASLFNRIPDVLAAAPGIVEITRMGPLTSTALR